eukprot:6463263-Pyramimonas_sp.AAC.1
MVTAAGDDSDSVHDALSVEQVKAEKAEAKEVLRNKLIKKVKDHLRGVVDTACVTSVMGDVWREADAEVLAELGISYLVEREEITEKFRFGDGGA